MTESITIDTDSSEEKTTGLPWPRTWNGAYLFVFATFVIWILLLVALTECCA